MPGWFVYTGLDVDEALLSGGLLALWSLLGLPLLVLVTASFSRSSYLALEISKEFGFMPRKKFEKFGF